MTRLPEQDKGNEMTVDDLKAIADELDAAIKRKNAAKATYDAAEKELRDANIALTHVRTQMDQVAAALMGRSTKSIPVPCKECGRKTGHLMRCSRHSA